jgi:hypothetical protein
MHQRHAGAGFFLKQAPDPMSVLYTAARDLLKAGQHILIEAGHGHDCLIDLGCFRSPEDSHTRAAGDFF